MNKMLTYIRIVSIFCFFLGKVLKMKAFELDFFALLLVHVYLKLICYEEGTLRSAFTKVQKNMMNIVWKKQSSGI